MKKDKTLIFVVTAEERKKIKKYVLDNIVLKGRFLSLSAAMRELIMTGIDSFYKTEQKKELEIAEQVTSTRESQEENKVKQVTSTHELPEETEKENIWADLNF